MIVEDHHYLIQWNRGFNSFFKYLKSYMRLHLLKVKDFNPQRRILQVTMLEVNSMSPLLLDYIMMKKVVLKIQTTMLKA
jgi:hypothetical protein